VHNHDQKVRDMARSVLPSTARAAARKMRRDVHRAARRDAAIAAYVDGVTPTDHRSRMAALVEDRRSADKIAPLVRWALHHVRVDDALRTAPYREQVAHFRKLLPDNTIGRHAVGHIASALADNHEAPPWRWFDRFSSPRESQATVEPLVRGLYEAGYHGELNKRLKVAQSPVLQGPADIATFAAAADRTTRDVVARLAAAVHLH
jgi:hypothetical protein